MQPPIRDHFHEILRWHRTVQWHSKTGAMFSSHGTLTQYELLRMQNLLRVTVFDQDPEWFCVAMIAHIPRE